MFELFNILLVVLGILGLLVPVFLIAILSNVKKIADKTTGESENTKNIPDRKKEPNYFFKDDESNKK